jgi:hypothetical protein
MEQIYYTQCPIGYGLGASNGFQIKRVTPGYPLSGDFRHLGLRAFLAGTRAMAPAALRYRRGEGGTVEVAFLTPRSHEYETERGSWGRPGGHFAHGLQLDAAELETIQHWPAGLFGSSLWRKSDPEPTRGRAPDPHTLSGDDLRWAPTFAAVAALAGRRTRDLLARLLTAVAVTVREGRTLFLIGEPEAVPEAVALLTFAFPEPLREVLTFSTYYDRPEELPGYRVQGTLAAARPNRQALMALGVVADLEAGSFAPTVEAESWATVLAGWLAGRSDEDRAAWEATNRLARRALAAGRLDSEPAWSDAWLDRLFQFHGLLRDTSRRPASAREWDELSATIRWAAQTGLAEDWVRARGPDWWHAAATVAAEGQSALLAHLGLGESWSGDGRASAWGEVVARWVQAVDAADRTAVVAAALPAAPVAARPGFVRSLVRSLPEAAAQDVLRRLGSQSLCDRSVLLPLEARGTVASALDHGDRGALDGLLLEAKDLPGVLVALLDALAAEARQRPGAIDALVGLLTQNLETAGRSWVAELVCWALAQGYDAVRWLGPLWRGVFSDPKGRAAWRDILRLTPDGLRPALARVVLTVARDPALGDEPFRWGVEDVLLTLPAAERPHDPCWPGTYLDRTPSGLALVQRLFTKEYRRLGVRRWLDEARGRGELSDSHAERIDGCADYARVLRSGAAQSLSAVKLPAVPAEERGAMLGQLLAHLGRGAADSLDLVLAACRDAWPGGFAPGAKGLSSLAVPLAETLLPARSHADRWLERLAVILDRLRLTGPEGGGFEPDGLAAEIVAVTVRRPEPGFSPWRFRQSMLQNYAAWRTLAVDIGTDLEGRDGVGSREVLDEWDHKLDKGLHTTRFYELWLNVSEGSALTAAVSSRAGDLRTLGDLPWWSWQEHPGACDDVRDRFARLAPLTPLAEATLAAVQDWMRRPRRSVVGLVEAPAAGDVDLIPLAEDDLPWARKVGSGVSPLSDLGRARWRCLEALATLHRAGLDEPARWQTVVAWRPGLPLGDLELGDRYRFLAWIIASLSELEYHQVARLANWLVELGLNDTDRIARWAEELSDAGDDRARSSGERRAWVADLRAEVRTLIRERKDRPAMS